MFRGDLIPAINAVQPIGGGSKDVGIEFRESRDYVDQLQSPYPNRLNLASSGAHTLLRLPGSRPRAHSDER